MPQQNLALGAHSSAFLPFPLWPLQGGQGRSCQVWAPGCAEVRSRQGSACILDSVCRAGGGVGRHPAPAAEPGTGAMAFRSPLGPAPWCDIPLQQDAGRQAGLLTRRGTPTGTRGGASVPPLVFRPLQVQTKARLSACTQLREPLPTQSFCPPLQLGELASGNGAIQLQASHTLAQA